jgi:hypothetical protein
LTQLAGSAGNVSKISTPAADSVHEDVPPRCGLATVVCGNPVRDEHDQSDLEGLLAIAALIGIRLG